MSNRTHKLGATIATALAALVFTQSDALAQVTIVRVNGGGAAPGTVAGGGNLADIFNAACDWWETALVTTPYTLTLTFQWGPQAGSTLAAHTLTTQGGVPNRETAGSITFDNDGSSSWFLDPTPGANDEYGTGPTFSSADLGGGILTTGKVFTGGSGSASGRTDLFSVCLHEIGHSLGLSSANTSFVAETGDGDVDVTAPRPFAGSAIPNVSGAHLNIGTALMFPSIGTSLRRWPTAVDAVANAQLSSMTDILRSYEPAGPSNVNLGAGIGSTTLVTPPNFVSNNGASVGGAVYFTLRVNSLIRLTGIDINTGVAAGTPIEADFYINTVETDVNLLTTGSPALPANNWQLRGRLSGNSAGQDAASVLTFAADPSLVPGEYLVAITGYFNPRYTTGTGSNETASGTALTFIAGAASNVAFQGTVNTPRVFNGRFRYQHDVCGTNTLTTPPLFQSNNNGSVGGAVYFQLDVTSSAGRIICGIDVNTSVAPGTPLTGNLYINQVETNIALLTTGSPALAATNWCPVSALTGVSNGDDVPSPMLLTNPLALPLGSYLCAVSGNFEHQYTTGTGTNEVVSGSGVTFRAGKASNVPFTGTVFSPRVMNATFQIVVPTTPITTFPFQALANRAGAGCGGSPGQVFENFAVGTFDLDAPARDIIFTFAGGSVTTTVAAGTAIVPPVAADLGLGDDQNTTLLPLGFTVSGLCADSISIASNGYIWLGNLGRADFTQSASEFVNEGARVAPYWTDLNPGAGGSVHLDLAAGQARVTWLNVFPFGGAAPEVTTQVVIQPNSIRIRYNPAGGAYASSALVGLTNGAAPAAVPAGIDFSAGGIAARPWNSHLLLKPLSRPILGSTTPFQTTGLVAGAIGATFASLGPASPGVPLFPITPPGCSSYLAPGFSSLGVFFGSCSGIVNVAVPSNPAIVGFTFAAQSISIDSSSVLTTSNVVDCRVGCF